jgi:hypothetical protein
MDMALSYFFVIVQIAYTIIRVIAALLCIHFFLWPLSLRLASFIWAISNNRNQDYWQAVNVQKTLTRLLHSVPLSELLFSQRLGVQLHQQLRSALPRLISTSIEQCYPRTLATVYPNWQAALQQFSSAHLAQVIDDFLDELRANYRNEFSLQIAKKTPLTFKQRIQNAQKLLAPIQHSLYLHMQAIIWFVVAISVMLILVIPFNTHGIILYVGISGLVMALIATWKTYQAIGLDAQICTQWSNILAADLSQQVYHLQPIFKAWQYGKLRHSLDNALGYQWGSAQFHASLANQLLEQLIQISQQPDFGKEQQQAIRNDLFKQFHMMTAIDRQLLFAQISGQYWRILVAILLVQTLLLTGMAYRYF